MQPLRGNPKEGQGRQMVAHSRLVVPGRWQRDKPGTVNPVIHFGDKVMRRVLELGRGGGGLMAKADIKQAYRNMPVHPEDRDLLGMQWQGQLLVDGCLPFGLRSAPLLFTVVADLLQWVMC